MRTITALAAGLLASVALVNSARASVDVYYAGAQLDAFWADGVSIQDRQGSFGEFGSKTDPVNLTDSWSFNDTVVVPAPGDSGLDIGAGGMAYGRGSLDTTVTPDGFTAKGHGYAEAQFDATGNVAELDGYGLVSFSMNFSIAPGSYQALTMSGTTNKTGLTGYIMARLMKEGDATAIFDKQVTDDFGNTTYYLSPGNYALDLYGASSFPPDLVYSDSMTVGNISALGEFDVAGVFVAVPEPVIGGLVLSGSLVALSRRKRNVR